MCRSAIFVLMASQSVSYGHGLLAWLAGPIGAVRVAKVGGGRWVVDPSLEQQKGAALSLLYAGTSGACTLLEIQVGVAQHATHQLS